MASTHSRPRLNRRSTVHISYQMQHSVEVRNPYPNLVAQMENLSIINIYPTGSSENKISDFVESPIVREGEKQTRASLPALHILSVADTLKDLGIEVAPFRVTAGAQTTIPHAPKPPSSYLKNGKSGMSYGVIPCDLNMATMLSSTNTITTLSQPKGNNIVPDIVNTDVRKVQWAKPLEQILEGLAANTPEFVLVNSPEEIKKTGILEVRINSYDGVGNYDGSNTNQFAIRDVIYRIDLKNTNLTQPLATDANRTSDAAKPTWWSDDVFGSFTNKVKCGFPIEYKTPNDNAFKPYEVYGRLNEEGEILAITGDQDGLLIPKSNIYNVGDLAKKELNTHDVGGTLLMMEKIEEVHALVLAQKNLSSEDYAREVEKFGDQLRNSEIFIEQLGVATAWEAYFITKSCFRLTELESLSPAEINERLKHIKVEVTTGLRNLPVMNSDIHLAWFSQQSTLTNEKGEPISMAETSSQYVAKQLERNFDVRGDILLLHMKHLESKGPERTAGVTMLADEAKSRTVLKSSRDTTNYAPSATLCDKMRAALKTIATKHPDWEISLTINGKSFDFKKLEDSKEFKVTDILISHTDANKQKQVVHIQGSHIYSNQSGDAGARHIKQALDAAQIPLTKNFVSTATNQAFSPPAPHVVRFHSG